MSRFKNDSDVHLILASRSPRRRDLLKQQGYSFDIVPSDDDSEKLFSQSLIHLPPREFVQALAKFKAENVAQKLIDSATTEINSLSFDAPERFVILACDSVAVCNDQILGKPKDATDARRMLQMLSGSVHFVHTGLCFWEIPNNRYLCVAETSRLRMEVLNEKQIDDYIQSGLWIGKAGAFGYQDGNDWLFLEEGSASNVVGLPLERFEKEWKKFLNDRF